jgi:hypothetical protein
MSIRCSRYERIRCGASSLKGPHLAAAAAPRRGCVLCGTRGAAATRAARSWAREAEPLQASGAGSSLSPPPPAAAAAAALRRRSERAGPEARPWSRAHARATPASPGWHRRRRRRKSPRSLPPTPPPGYRRDVLCRPRSAAMARTDWVRRRWKDTPGLLARRKLGGSREGYMYFLCAASLVMESPSYGPRLRC